MQSAYNAANNQTLLANPKKLFKMQLLNSQQTSEKYRSRNKTSSDNNADKIFQTSKVKTKKYPQKLRVF